MKTVMEESEKSLDNLKKADNTKHAFDVSNWCEFSCRKLFDSKNTGNILAREVEDGSGTTPFVTASGYNNGVVGYIDASKYEIIKGHCILVGGKTFTITYQKDDFDSLNKLTEDRKDSARTLEKTSMRGLKDSVVDKYSDQAHFIYELIQNADDVGATYVTFSLYDDHLVFIHNGTRHFDIGNFIFNFFSNI